MTSSFHNKPINADASLKMQKWMMCALILFGALAACSTAPTPIAVATSTLIPSTATDTATPLTPSATPQPSATKLATATTSYENFHAIISSDVTPDMGLMSQIFDDLARELSVSVNRIQLVLLEEGTWSRRTLGCNFSTPVPISVIADEPDREVDGFRFVLLVGNTLYEYHTEGLERFSRCPDAVQAQDDLLIAIDPVAADILRLVQRRIAAQLDLSTRRIQLVNMSAISWSDTSLGCPQEEQNYNEADIAGYRIVVNVGDINYIFHSDSVGIYPCTEEQEVLPED